MRTLLPKLLILLVLPLISHGQSDFIIPKPKDLKCEYTPVPRDFKTGKISWGEVDCISEAVKFGNWYRLYPSMSQLRVTVSTGYNWGNLSDPIIYVAHLDTVDGQEVLVPKGCRSFQGAEGDFLLEVSGLIPHQKHYMLIGGSGKKERYALYLTQRFASTVEEVEPEESIDTIYNDLDDEVIPPEQGFELTESEHSIIIGRIRHPGDGPFEGLEINLLNDDLQSIGSYETDESGFFRFENVDHSVINLVKILGTNEEYVLDMFMYNDDGRIIGKPVSLGHNLHSFEARSEYFDQLSILTEKDVFVKVTRGNSSMTGKVVDRETFLIGIPGVEVGLYNAKKNLLSTTESDEDGKFSFEGLDDQEYIVKVNHDPKKNYVEIVLTDELNVPYAVSNSDDMDVDGYFRFRRLQEETVKLRRMEAEDASSMEDHRYALISNENRGNSIELTSIEFDMASSELEPGKNDELDQLARELETHPGERVRIEGHTDNVGDEQVNLALSKARAEAVKSYLVNKGISADRIDCIGHGPKKPIANNNTEEGRRLNRRVEFLLLEP